MTLRAHLIRILSWWRSVHPDRALETIPEYASAARRERQAIKRGRTREIHQARQDKRQAVHMALRGGA